MNRNAFRVILVLALAGLCLRANAHPPQHGDFLPVEFIDASNAVEGFTHGTSIGDGLSGVAWLDYDNDGWLDFYVANGTPHDDGLLHNNGDGTFTNVSSSAGLADGNGSTGVVAADLDNDGDSDLVVTGDPAAFVGIPSLRAIRVFSNNGDGTFNDITAASGVAIPSSPGSAMHPTLGDINNDGYLDLFVTAPASLTNLGVVKPNHLFLNQGGLTFTDISASSGVGYSAASCEATFSHYDDDGYIDLFIADCNLAAPPPPGFPLPLFKAEAIRLFKNNGDNTFTQLEVGLPSPPPPEQQPFPPPFRGFWMCVGLGDIDLDQDFDLFSSNVGRVMGPNFPEPHGLFRRNADGAFTSIEVEAGITANAMEFSWGCSFADFNNDGWEDLIFVGNFPVSPFNSYDSPGYLFVNEGGNTFRPEPLPVSLLRKYSSGLASADYDNDGSVDVVVSNASYNRGGTNIDLTAQPTLFKNVGNDNHWLTVRLKGRPPSNRSAVGALVKVSVANRVLVKEVRAGSSFASQDSLWLTFGLNRQPRARRIEVTWPSGRVETFKNVRGDRRITIVEGRGIVGSH